MLPSFKPFINQLSLDKIKHLIFLENKKRSYFLLKRSHFSCYSLIFPNFNLIKKKWSIVKNHFYLLQQNFETNIRESNQTYLSLKQFLGTKISIINEIYQNYFSMVLRWLKYPNCSPQICNQTDKSHDFFSHKNFSTRAIKLFKRGQHIYMSMKRVSLFFSFLFYLKIIHM